MNQLSLFEQRIELLTPDEIYESADETLLRSFQEREDRRIEFKSPTCRLKTLAEYISMWANTAPNGGIVVVGVKNDVEFIGCSGLGQRKINEIERVGHTFCPDAKYVVKRVAITTEKHRSDFLILIKVEYHPKRVVCTNEGKAFTRISDSKHELNPSEITLLRQDKGEINYEQEPCGLAFPEAFQMDKVVEFVEALRTLYSLTEARTDTEILVSQHLGVVKGESFIPNLACALLFAKDPSVRIPGCMIHFLRFQGEDAGTGARWTPVKDEMPEGTIPELIAWTESMLKSQLRTFTRYEKGKFHTSPEYPHEAWYEAIVNACVHRSYSNGLQNKPIFVRMFEDRLEIESPGPFPPFVTPKNIYTEHHPRNPKLMHAMRHLKYVRCATEGTRRMRDSMTSLDLPWPEFEQKSHGGASVLVTLRNSVKQRKVWVDKDVAVIVGTAMAGRLSESQKRVLNAMAEFGDIGVNDAMRLLQTNWPAAKTLLKGLVEIGVVVRNPGTKGRYRLADGP